MSPCCVPLCPPSPYTEHSGPASNIASISMAFGFAITVLVHSLGHISGVRILACCSLPEHAGACC